ncbi:MAG: hypothetical protein ACRD3H_08490 [Terriglobales bacterium]
MPTLQAPERVKNGSVSAIFAGHEEGGRLSFEVSGLKPIWARLR